VRPAIDLVAPAALPPLTFGGPACAALIDIDPLALPPRRLGCCCATSLLVGPRVTRVRSAQLVAGLPDSVKIIGWAILFETSMLTDWQFSHLTINIHAVLFEIFLMYNPAIA
jgi:hypothetical protein